MMQVNNNSSTKHTVLYILIAFSLAIFSLLLATNPFLSAFLLIPLLIIPFLNTAFQFNAPVNLLRKVIFLTIVVYFIWPRYLALKFAGPDITPQRLLQVILLFFWFVSIASPSFRGNLIHIFKSNRLHISLLLLYVIWRLVSSITSIAPANSIYYFLNEAINNALLLLILMLVLTKAEHIDKLARIFIYISFFITLLAFYEFSTKSLIFSHIHLPPGMQINAEFLAQALSDKSRAGSYRAQATFMHPLLLAEFAIFATPFAFYLVNSNSKISIKVLSLVTIAFLLITSYFTGSRAGLLIELLVISLCVMVSLWNLIKSNGYGYLGWLLIVIIIFLGLSLITYLIFEGMDLSYIKGKSTIEIQSSNARIQMLERGIPLIMSKPLWGYGPSMAGYILHFTGTNGSLTIDNFYLSLALDSGLLGLVFFISFIVSVVYSGIKSGLEEKQIGLPMYLALSIIGMLILLSVVSLDYNIPLLFIASAIILNLKAVSTKRHKS